jgi:signal peptidase I
MVNKLAFRLGVPERGDVVVFRDPAEPEIDESIPEAVIRSVLEAVGIRTRGRDDLIKRVIGLPGDTITIADNRVHIDGIALSEPYLADNVVMPNAGPFQVGEEEVFLMGDNRQFSFDSRRFGNISFDALVGRAFVIIWPVSNFEGL